LEARWKKHLKAKTGCTALIRALKKYGPHSFSREVVAEADTQESLDALEETWIKTLGSLSPNGYNLHSDARGGWGSKESLERLRASAKAARQRMADEGKPKGETSLSEGDVREIFSRFDQGDLQKDIAKDFNVEPSTIAHILRGTTWGHLGLTTQKDTRRALRPSEVLAILTKHYDEGVPSSDLQLEFDLSKGCVNKILRGASWADLHAQVTKGRHRQGTGRPSLGPEVWKVRTQEGLSYPQLAKRFDISTAHAWRLCKAQSQSQPSSKKEG
jgi:transposase